MRYSAARGMMMAGLVSCVGILALSRAADATPIQYGNSFYEFIPDEAVSWSEASSTASASTFNGMQGYLATVTSSGENNFLLGLITPLDTPQGAWLGGAVNGAQTATWATGPENGQLMSFTNFGGSEPNSGPGNVYMNIGTTLAGVALGQWADAAGGINGAFDQIAGYFVEYPVNPVPIPAALPLMLTALAGFGFLGWRRKKLAAE
jgi:hypothetical protein